MIYRVILHVGYNEAWFDFEDMNEAGDFARTILTKHQENEDTRKRNTVTIKVIDPSIVIDEEED